MSSPIKLRETVEYTELDGRIDELEAGGGGGGGTSGVAVADDSGLTVDVDEESGVATLGTTRGTSTAAQIPAGNHGHTPASIGAAAASHTHAQADVVGLVDWLATLGMPIKKPADDFPDGPPASGAAVLGRRYLVSGGSGGSATGPWLGQSGKIATCTDVAENTYSFEECEIGALVMIPSWWQAFWKADSLTWNALETPPFAHAPSHASDGSDPIAPESIGAAAASHEHEIADVDGLQTALDAKAATTHAALHATGQSDAITPASIGAAASSHTHVLANITDAAAALAGKLSAEADDYSAKAAPIGADHVVGFDSSAADTAVKIPVSTLLGGGGGSVIHPLPSLFTAPPSPSEVDDEFDYDINPALDLLTRGWSGYAGSVDNITRAGEVDLSRDISNATVANAGTYWSSWLTIGGKKHFCIQCLSPNVLISKAMTGELAGDYVYAASFVPALNAGTVQGTTHGLYICDNINWNSTSRYVRVGRGSLTAAARDMVLAYSNLGSGANLVTSGVTGAALPQSASCYLLRIETNGSNVVSRYTFGIMDLPYGATGQITRTAEASTLTVDTSSWFTTTRRAGFVWPGDGVDGRKGFAILHFFRKLPLYTFKTW